MAVNIRHSRPTAPPVAPFTWPNASNTGVPAGEVLTAYGGPYFITTPNLLITNRTIASEIQIQSGVSGVTFRNCRFTTGGSRAITADGAPNVTIEDCEFSGAADQTILAQGIFTRLNIYNSRIALNLKDGQSTVKRCYIHDLKSTVVAPHFDGIFMLGGQSNTLIEDCWIDVPAKDGTADIFIAAQYPGSPITNTTVNHCRLLGGPSYAMYNADQQSPVTGTSWTNNEVQRGGSGGYFYISPTTTVFKSGNVDYLTGVNIDNQG